MTWCYSVQTEYRIKEPSVPAPHSVLCTYLVLFTALNSHPSMILPLIISHLCKPLRNACMHCITVVFQLPSAHPTPPTPSGGECSLRPIMGKYFDERELGEGLYRLFSFYCALSFCFGAQSLPSKLSSLSPAPVRCCTGSSELSFQPLNLGKIPYHAMPCHTLQYLPWPTMSMILYHPSIIHTRPLTLVVGAWWLVVGGWWLDFVR